MARHKALSLEEAFARVREHYTVTFNGYSDTGVVYAVQDSERYCLRTDGQIMEYATTGRDPFNWLPDLNA